jgi:hypothetical protein
MLRTLNHPEVRHDDFAAVAAWMCDPDSEIFITGSLMN